MLASRPHVGASATGEGEQDGEGSDGQGEGRSGVGEEPYWEGVEPDGEGTGSTELSEIRLLGR